jgi:hypothetical protein
MTVPITNVTNLQELEAHVSGPGPANRMFVVSGIGAVQLVAGATAGQVAEEQETFTLLVGPTLTSGQFVKALATASPSALVVYPYATDPGASGQWRVTNVDADFDDESGRTELRIEAAVRVRGAGVELPGIAFQATILAAL